MRAASAIVLAVSLVGIAGLAGCPASLPAYEYVKEEDPRNQELILGVGDVIAINVWENNQLNTEATIRPDGTITMPLVGDLKAAGVTPSALKLQIKQRLGDFVKLQGTEITVAVKAWKSYRFTVEGEVTKQGVFSSDSYVTISEALAMAGGLSRFAKRSDIKVLRRNSKGELREIPIEYDILISGQHPEMNIYLKPGDIVSVP